MLISILTLGCKVNTYESEVIRDLFIKNNDSIVDIKDHPDVIVINTCTVTNGADAKSRKLIRSAKRNNPKAILIVCGCFAEQYQEELSAFEIDILIGNKDKTKIIDLLNNFLKTKESYYKFYDLSTISFEDMRITNFEGRTRAFVKLQDGCNNFCSYCIIPYVRGRNRNKDFDTAVEEIKTLTENGYKEIVLTGIHTGSYVKLIELINQITLLPKLKRIRISSLEITEINKEFLELLKVNSKVCNHLHIPLQSGSDNVLKQMNRKYSIQYYQEVINKIREASPDINITTDIIVGFPTETETDFNETLKFAKAIGFGKIHVFPYSKRNNTVAATLKSVLDEKEKKERVNRLLSLSDELEQLYYQQFINNQLEVLIEEVGKNYSAGYTSNYVKVVVNKELNQNDEISVIVNKLTKGNVEGKIIE